MAQLLKRFLKIFLVLVLTVFLGMLAIVYFVDPNSYKSTIEAKVLAETGHNLSIKGPIGWKLFPTLILELQDIALSNQKPFSNEFFTAKKIHVDLAFSSLFTGKVAVNLKLKGANIYLLKNPSGQGNWESLLQRKVQQTENINTANTSNDATILKQNSQAVSKQSSQTAQTPETLKTSESSQSYRSKDNSHDTLSTDATKSVSTGKTPAISVLLNSVKIENSEVLFQDKEKNSEYQIKQLNLFMDNVMKGSLGVDNPVSLSFEWFNLGKKTSGKTSLKADWALNLLQDELNIRNISLNLENLDEKKSELKTRLIGDLQVKNIRNNPTMEGKIESKEFELTPWLNNFGIINTALPSSANIKAQFKYHAPYLTLDNVNVQFRDNGRFACNFKIDTTKLTAKNFDLQGNFIGNQLKYNKIELEEIKGEVSGKVGVIDINPLVFKIAENLHQADIKVDLRGNLAKYTIRNQSHNFDIMPLLILFGVETKLEGKANLKLDLSASGNNAEQIRQSLSGNSEIEIKEGKFSGADIVALLKGLNSNIYNLTSSLAKKPSLNLLSSAESLQDLSKQKQSAINPNATTEFTSLKASININNGVAHNPNLLISHPEYSIQGQGKVNFIHNTIEYHAAAQLKNNPYPPKDDLANYLYSTSLPINISGSLGNLSILPDIKTYANNAFVFAQKNIVQKSIQKETSKVVNNIIGGAIDKSGDQNVNKAIENTLNSLFK